MSAGKVTALIEAANEGDEGARAALFSHVYGELKILARKQLRGMPSATIGTTGVVHEAYLKIARSAELSLRGRSHFFALAAKAMRQIVIDHARSRVAEQRGGANVQVVPIDDADAFVGAPLSLDKALRLDTALADLERDEPRLSSLVEMRFFAGLELAEIAEMGGVSVRTLHREWRRARALLFSAIHEG